MNFFSAFWTALKSRPLEALAALYWRITGRKVRARNRLRISVAQSPFAYPQWIRTIERTDDAAGDAASVIMQWQYRPIFSVILQEAVGWQQADLENLILTLRTQPYPDWELLIVATPDATRLSVPDCDNIRRVTSSQGGAMAALRAAASLAKGEFLMPLPFEALLTPTCLFRYANALQSRPDATLLFGDNDWIDAQGDRDRPWFKPQWNSELVLAQDYLSQAFVMSSAAAATTINDLPDFDIAASYALALAIGWKDPRAVIHVPYVQIHLTGSYDVPTDDRKVVVEAQLARIGADDAKVLTGPFDMLCVNWPLPEPRPLVSIIIPTRDKVELLRACIGSLLGNTRYESFEILVVDNGSSQISALAYLEEIASYEAVRVVRDNRPYNFSQLNNMAAQQAQGSYLCLLNNDTEVVDGDWLTAMMRQAVRPNAGAVGAKLLYADGSIQHAGVTVGLGDAAGHAHRFLKGDQAGYFGRAHAAHYVSAVTAACLVVEKSKFFAVGGLDEDAFAIAFNDVDFCLKLRQAGWDNIYTPAATLVHHESKSRGKDVSPQHIERYRRELGTLRSRWATATFADPLHHEKLNRATENYLLGF